MSGRVLVDQPLDGDLEFGGARVEVPVPAGLLALVGGERREVAVHGVRHGFEGRGSRAVGVVLAVGRGDVGDAEPLVDRFVDLEVGGAGDGGERVGVGGADDGAGLGGAEGAQADPVGEVGLQAAQPALLQPLGGQQQVHAERPADAADLDEQVDEVRALGEELAELVDDDQQVGQRFQRLAVDVGAAGRLAELVFADGVDVPGLAQHPLAALLFAGEGLVHPVDHGEVVGEVGDQAGYVREFGDAREGGAALEVDEHERQVLGGVHHGEPGDQGAQQFALAGAGGADDESVRADAALRGLLEVHGQRFAGAGHPDGDAEQFLLVGGAAPGGRVEGRHVGDAEHAGEGDVLGEDLVALAGEAQRGERAGGGRQDGGVGLVDDALLDGGVQAGRAALQGERAAGVRTGSYVDPARLRALLLDQAHHVDAQVGAGLGDQVLQEGGAGPGRPGLVLVEEDHQLAAGGDLPRGDDAAVSLRAGGDGLVEGLLEVLVEPGEVVGQQGYELLLAALGRRVGVLGVRQPLGPLPGGVAAGDDRDPYVVRGVQHGELEQHRLGQLAGAGARAEQADHAGLGEVQPGGLALDRAVRADQFGGGVLALGVDVDGRVALVRHAQLGGERHGAGAHPQVQEVAVGGAAFPHPAAPGGDRPEPVRVRVLPDVGGPLGDPRAQGLLADPGEVLQIPLPLPELVAATAAPQLHPDADGDADGDHDEGDAQQNHPRLAVGDHVGRHAHAGQQRQQEHQPARRALGLGPLGRAGQVRPALRLRRGRHADGAVEGDSTHVGCLVGCRGCGSGWSGGLGSERRAHPKVMVTAVLLVSVSASGGVSFGLSSPPVFSARPSRNLVKASATPSSAVEKL